MPCGAQSYNACRVVQCIHAVWCSHAMWCSDNAVWCSNKAVWCSNNAVWCSAPMPCGAQNKDVAVAVTPLPRGSVIFEDVRPGVHRGTVLRPIKPSLGRRQSQSEPTPPSQTGRISFTTETGWVGLYDHNLHPNLHPKTHAFTP